MRFAAAILAGGAASRLGGIAKGLIIGVGNISWIQRLINELAIAGIEEVILSVNDRQPYLRIQKRLLPDWHPGRGPLGGIETVLQHFGKSHDSVLFLPCDLPSFSAAEMSLVMEAHQSRPDRIVMAETARSQHPLCAAVPVSVLPAVSAAIASGQCSVGRLWRELAAEAVRLPNSASLTDINTPETLSQWQKLAGLSP